MFDRWIRGYWGVVPVIVRADSVLAVHSAHCADPFPFSVVVNTAGTELWEANDHGEAAMGLIASDRDLLCPLEWKLACDWLDDARRKHLAELDALPETPDA